jgi:cell wall-associated NlpC family hydrolase
MNSRSQYIANLCSIIGFPYQWGAWGPSSFDCSGAVSWALGLTEKKCVADLFHNFKGNAIEPKQASPGTLYFYGTDINHIDHVMSVLQHWDSGYIVLIGSCHGDETTTTPERAAYQNAFVMTQPQSYWQSHFQEACDPFNGQA